MKQYPACRDCRYLNDEGYCMRPKPDIEKTYFNPLKGVFLAFNKMIVEERNANNTDPLLCGIDAIYFEPKT